MSLAAADVGTWEWNIRTGEVSWSDNLERIHRQEPGSFHGTFASFLESVYIEDRDRVLKAIQAATEGAKDYHVEYRCPTDGDGELWFEARGRVISSDSGEPAWMLGVCMDITERKNFQQQLRQSQKMESLGVLAGGVAHDFNNLLTGILGNASLAYDRLDPSNPSRNLLRDVVVASRRAADLTRQLLAFAGKSRLVIEDIDIPALITELVPLVEKSIPEGAELRLDLTPMSIRADVSQIQQVVMNLIINAAEAIGEGNTGTVFITTRVREFREPIEHQVAAGTYGCLEVRDTGCGMEESTVARIFDPFFSTKFTGRGLGLAAARGIVHGHRGAITVKSTPGVGSTFAVMFPACEDPAPPPQGETESKEAIGAGTILVVDDEDLILRLAEASLAAFGYRPLAAPSGRAALEILKAPGTRVAVVVLDLMMPGMSGEETLREMRAMVPDLPVVITSGCGEIEVRERFDGKGANGFLPKPYTARQLAQVVQDALLAAGRAVMPASR